MASRLERVIPLGERRQLAIADLNAGFVSVLFDLRKQTRMLLGHFHMTACHSDKLSHCAQETVLPIFWVSVCVCV